MGHKRGPGGRQFICKTKGERPILKGEVKEALESELSDICKKYQLEDVTIKVFPYLFVLIFAGLRKISPRDFADELLIRTQNLLKNEFMYGEVWADEHILRTVGDVSEEAVERVLRQVEESINESD